MNDFTNMEETMAFFVLGPMRPGEELPLVTIDISNHAIRLMKLGAKSEDYNGLMERFSRTFEPDAGAPGGGDIAFVSEELFEFFKKGGEANGKGNGKGKKGQED